MEVLFTFLAEVIKNSHKCAHCIFNHDGQCFFAYQCIKYDWSFYNEGVD